MELNCSFRDIVGGECGLRRTDIEKRRFAKSSGEPTIVPLLSCGKDIKAHKSMYSFTDPSEEIDLILCRSGVFRKPNNLQSWTICAHHRYSLGLGWTRGSNTRCRVPFALSSHGKRRGKWPKCERGINKSQSKIIKDKTGIYISVGSGNKNTSLIVMVFLFILCMITARSKHDFFLFLE